jgi:hypothetical protein
MHFNRMAFDHLSAGAGGGGGGGGGIDSREESGDAARSRDGLPDDDDAADRSGEEEEVPGLLPQLRRQILFLEIGMQKLHPNLLTLFLKV